MIVEMEKRRSCRAGYSYAEIINGGQTGNSVRILPASSQGPITCTIIAGANTGKFQFTTSPDSRVTAGTANWMDWYKGEVTGTDYDILNGPVTALRGVSTSGAITIEIVR